MRGSGSTGWSWSTSTTRSRSSARALDRHEHLGAGRIGAAGPCATCSAIPALAHVTYYLETPGMDEGYDAINVARAYDIAAGRPLADLPPEALERARAVGPGPAAASPAR